MGSEGTLRFGTAAGRWVMTAAVLGTGIVFLDGTVVTVALPQIGRELPVTYFGVLEGQAYIYYGYLLALSSLLILAGALADYHGRRLMFGIGLIGFGVTSFLCGIATNIEMLIGLRILQGAAGAILVPGSLAIITATFDGEDQGRAFGLWAAASSATTLLGPVVGGALVSYVSWRAAFFINIPLIAVALFATVRHLPESKDEEASGQFDWLGAVVIALAVGGLTFGAIRGESASWGDPIVVASLAIGGLSAIVFPAIMAKRPNPLVPLRLFRSRNFTVTNLSTLVIYGALYVTFQYFTIYAVGTLGYNALAIGLGGLPGSLFLIFLSSRIGRLAVRWGPRMFMTVGPAVMGLGLLWYTRIPADSPGWAPTPNDLSTFVPSRGYLVDVLPALLVFGIGLAIMVAPLTTALMRSVPAHNSGVASAINNAISRVGPQFVGALLFVAISGTFYSSLASETGRAVTDRVRTVTSPLNAPSEEAPPEVRAAAPRASTDAFRLAMLVSAGLCFLGAGINGVGIRNEQLEQHAEELRPEKQPAHAHA